MSRTAGARPSQPGTNALGRTLLAVGDHRKLSIIGGAFRGCRRFSDWQSVLDISPPVLSDRLRALVENGIFELVPYQDSPPRSEYRLTAAGADLWGLVVALWMWDGRWGERLAQPRLVHRICGAATRPLFGCGCCGALSVTAQDTTAVYTDAFSAANPARRYRRASRPDDSDGGGDGAGAGAEAISAADLLGDRWSTSVLSAAFLGARRFKDFQQLIATIPPLMLTDRLDHFVRHQVLRRAPIADGGKRMEYSLAPKGMDFFPVMAAVVAWTNAWLAPPDDPPIVIHHRACGRPFDPRWICNVCSQPMERATAQFEGHK